MPLLRLIVDGQEVKRCDISAPVVVGRGEECDLRIVDAQVSRLHCRIEPSREGWVVVDLGSHNGTLLGGKPVDRQVLRDGDQLEVGSAILQFEAARLSAELAALQQEMEADRDEPPPSPSPLAASSAAGDTQVGVSVPTRPVNLWKHAQRPTPPKLRPRPTPGAAAHDRPTSLAGRCSAALRSIRRRVFLTEATRAGDGNQPWYRRRIPLPVGVAIALVVSALLYILVFGFPTLGKSAAPPPPKLPHSSPRNND